MCSRKSVVVKLQYPLQVPLQAPLHSLYKVPHTCQLRPAHRTLIFLSALIKLHVEISVKQTDRCPMETRTTTSTTVLVDTMCSRKSAAVKELQLSLLPVRKVALSWQLRPAHQTLTSLNVLIKLYAEISVKQTDHCPTETRITTSTTVVDMTCSRKPVVVKELRQNLLQLHKVPHTCQLRPAHLTLTSRSALIKLHVEISVKQTDRCPMGTRTTTSTTVLVDTMCSRKSAVVKVLQQSLLRPKAVMAEAVPRQEATWSGVKTACTAPSARGMDSAVLT